MKYSLCLLVFLPAVLGITYTPGTDTCEGRCLDDYDLYNICQCTENCELFGDCCIDFFVHCVEPPVAEDSCQGRCGQFSSSRPCQCNDGCVSYGDCCDDYEEFCGDGGVDPGTTCDGRCENGYEPGLACQCNDQCEQYNNCCSDYVEKCVISDNLCKGRCGIDYDPALPCQCNTLCPQYSNCCPDYATECSASCDERCDDPFDGNQPCQCNEACVTHGDCCLDYNEICLNGTGPQPITEADITALAESLWTLDVNRLSPYDYTINKQSVVDDNNDVDQSPDPFFTNLNESVLSSRTYQAFIALMDNYIPQTSNEEIYTLEELAEIEEFLDAVFESDVMSATTQFFIEKGWHENETDYRAWVKEVWFGNYSRRESDPFFDSSGFEHVFIGEIRGDVTGFHNWLQFYFQEKAGELEYYGYVRENDPDQIGLQFTWKNALKALGSMIIGASPEFELAMYSVCFRVKGGSQCSFTLDGSSSKIQTYEIRDAYIGSAYFIV